VRNIRFWEITQIIPFRKPSLKYYLVGGCLLRETVRSALGFLDKFYDSNDENEFLPVCLSRGGNGKYGTMVNIWFLLFVDIAPILTYALAYIGLYKQYKKVVSTHGSASSLAEIKKKLNSHVKFLILFHFVLTQKKIKQVNRALIFAAAWHLLTQFLASALMWLWIDVPYHGSQYGPFTTLLNLNNSLA